MKRIFILASLIFSFILVPKLVFAATLYVNPGSGSFSVGTTFNVSVRSNTQGAAVNTAEASISYSTDTLELVSVAQGSTFYLSSPGSPQKGSGSAYFAGGLPTPGYNGAGGILGSMTFRAKAAGTATVSISSGKVLLNDGQGTDALTTSANARFTITPPPVAGPQVSSSTHPDQSKWYAKNQVDLSWTRPADAYGFSFELDQDPNTIPDSTLDTTITTTKSYSDLKDGTWYFHVKARPQAANASFGATTHYKVQIDTTAPDPFEIGVDQLTISFSTKDATSGIDHYEISSNGKVLDKNATSPFTLTNLKSGVNQITVVSFDKAGNTTSAQTTVTIQGIGFFNRTLQVPLYIILFLILIILILISLVFFLLGKRRGRKRAGTSDLEKLQEEVDRLKREYSQSQNVKKEIAKTKRSIESKLNKIKKGR